MALDLLDFDFRGREDGGVLPGGERRQIDLRRAPSFVPQSTAGGRLGGHIADELDDVRIFGRGLANVPSTPSMTGCSVT